MDLIRNIAYSLVEKKDQNITDTLTLQEGLKRALLKFNEERPIFFLKKKTSIMHCKNIFAMFIQRS